MRLVAFVLAALALAGPAAAADREVLFGDAFRLETADPGPFDQLADGRLACLSDACAGRTVAVGGVTVRVLPRVTPDQVGAAKPPYRAPTGLPTRSGAGPAAGLLFAAAGLLAVLAAVLVAGELRRRRGEAPVDRLRRALRLVRESAGRAPGDRRRALDHLATTLGEAPPARAGDPARLGAARARARSDACDRGRGRAVTTIPFGELDAIAPSTRRTLALRVLLGLAAVVTAAAVVVLSRGETPPQGLLPAGSDGLVVLDLSASISSDTYARIGATLDRLAGSGGRYGVIVFSDTAYLALPPGTPAAELLPFARRFDLPAKTSGAIAVPTNPWTGSFSAGTKISTGLQLALDTIREQRLGRPAVLLVSDLDDDVGDLERLTTTALSFRRLGIPVRVVGLNAAPEDERYMERLLRQSGDLSPAAAAGEEQGRRGHVRLSLLLAALAAAVALALRELLLTRLERA